MERLDSRILIRALRELEPELTCAGALRHCLLVNENAEGRLVRGLKGNPTWPDHRTWAENAAEFLVPPDRLEQTARELGLIRLKGCFASDESEITSLEERLVLLIDAVLANAGPFPPVRERLAALLRGLGVSPAEVAQTAAFDDPSALSQHLASRAKNKGLPLSEVRRKRNDGAAGRNAFLPLLREDGPEGPIDPRLLADIRARGTVYRQEGHPRSPLLQILTAHPGTRFFLLMGEGESGAAGAGKTTALLRLRQETAPDSLYVSLPEVYNPGGLRALSPRPGQPRLAAWLEQQGQEAALQGDQLLLLDGLDEISSAEGVAALCDDLLYLELHTRVRAAAASALAPELLPAWHGLRNISSTWAQFLRCVILPMRPAQKIGYLGARADSPSMLTTPYLLLASRAAEGAAAADRALFSRWASPEGAPADGAALFLRAQAARICQWFRSDRGNDARTEADAFYLTFALPAVAFHLTLRRLYDRDYAPDIPLLRPAQLLDQAFPAYRRALHRFPAYRDDSSLAALAGDGKGPDAAAFARSRAGTVLCRSLCRETLEWEYRFINPSTREWLAALHLANLFLAARSGGLSPDPELADFYACPTRFLPRTMLERAAGLLNELLRDTGGLTPVLQAGPAGLPHGPSRCLTARLAAAMAAAVCPQQELLWREEGARVCSASAAEHEHAANLCACSALLREEGDLPAAARMAREAIAFAKTRGIAHSDGYQALSMVCFTRMGRVLNGTDPTASVSVTEEEYAHARAIHRELADCVTTGGGGAVFPAVPAENRALIPAFLQILDRAMLRLTGWEADNGLTAGLLRTSYTAKAFSVYAALSPASSGAAVNLLAGFLENQQEVLENHPALPLYSAHPHLRPSIAAERLAYCDGDRMAALAYLRIAGLRRGLQPYSCRNLAMGLLTRRFRLDSSGVPVPPEGTDRPFTPAELAFLDEMTRRACSSGRPAWSIPRIRFLNDRIDALSSQPDGGEEAAELAEEAGELFRREWALGRCDRKLETDPEGQADLLCAMLAGEYRPRYLPHGDPARWAARLRDFFDRQTHAAPVYTTGLTVRADTLAHCRERLDRAAERWAAE